MSGVIARSLVLLSTAMLALPAGFCCYAGIGSCCHKSQPVEGTPIQDSRDCCCCSENQRPDPCDPDTAPSKPGKSWCCEQHPTNRPDVKTQPPDLFAVSVAVPLEVSLPVAPTFLTESW